jgi:hypothetical protein
MDDGIFGQVLNTGGSILSDVIGAGRDLMIAREATRQDMYRNQATINAASAREGINTERFRLALMGVLGLAFAYLVFKRSKA